jgi:hypothetical protein
MKRCFSSAFICLCTLISLLVPNTSGFAQQNLTLPQSLSIQAGYGWDLDNKSNLNNTLYKVQIGYQRALTPLEMPWIKRINAEQWGVHLGYYALDQMREEVNDQTYSGGYGLAIHGDLDLRLLRLGKSRLLMQPGMGISYISQTAYTQPETSIIGSHLNISLNAFLTLAMPLSKQMELRASGGFQHFSNGGWSVPNGGWNTFIVKVGSQWRLAIEKQVVKPVSTDLSHKHGLDVLIGTGVRGKYRDQSKKFIRSGGYLGYRYKQNESVHFKGGLHALYYHSVFSEEQFDETFQYYGSSYDHWRVGAALGVAYQMGKFGVEGMYGRYLHFNSFHDLQDYWTLGAQYQLWGPIHWQSTLYMHKVQADFIQHGLSLRF